MADVKGQVDWGALESSAEKALDNRGVDIPFEAAFEGWLRTTFEPLVKAAEAIHAYGTRNWLSRHSKGCPCVVCDLRAALDGLPKVGG